MQPCLLFSAPRRSVLQKMIFAVPAACISSNKRQHPNITTHTSKSSNTHKRPRKRHTTMGCVPTGSSTSPIIAGITRKPNATRRALRNPRRVAASDKQTSSTSMSNRNTKATYERCNTHDSKAGCTRGEQVRHLENPALFSKGVLVEQSCAHQSTRAAGYRAPFSANSHINYR